MEDKLRERLRLMIGIKLASCHDGVKHDFWRQAQPQNEQATKKLVDTIVNVIDEAVEVAEKVERRRYMRN